MNLRKTTLSLLSFFMTITLVFGCEETRKTNTNRLLANAEITNIEKTEPIVQIALLLDTSNSMDGLINQAKSQLWDIVNEFSTAKCGDEVRPKLQIAIYQYGNDGLSSRQGYVQQVLNFSSDLDEISEKLFSLSTNGGEEYCGKVIQTSLEQLEWKKSKDQLRMIFIAGNEPFDQGNYSYQNASEHAKEKDIIVNTIYCGNYEQGIDSYWKDGAVATGGEYMAIDQNKEIVYVKTPFDEIIIKLNKRLNRTYISYGSLGKSKLLSQELQDSNAMAYEQTVAVKRAVSKSSRLYNNKSWDLVDAASDSEFELSEIATEELPAELKGKSESEIKEFIEQKKLERESVQKEIQEVNKKREAYLAKNQANSENGGLENVMLQAIKKQAESKNYSWD